MNWAFNNKQEEFQSHTHWTVDAQVQDFERFFLFKHFEFPVEKHFNFNGLKTNIIKILVIFNN